jgi:spermidine/putrescine-binding protein
MKDNPNIEYFVPNWTNFWIDNFVLPSNGTQSDEIKRAAYEFINFMLQKENATRNMVTVGAATAIKLTTDEKYALDSTDTMFPSATILSNGGVMRDFETDLLESDVNSLMIDIINKAATIPEEKRSLLWLWIILGVIAAGGLAYLTYWLLNRQRMRNASV